MLCIFSFLPVVTRIVYYFSVNQILMLPMVTAGIADETARKKGEISDHCLLCIVFFGISYDGWTAGSEASAI